MNNEGQPYYMVSFNNNTIIDTSFISFEFKDLPALKDQFIILTSTVGRLDEAWQMPLGRTIKCTQ